MVNKWGNRKGKTWCSMAGSESLLFNAKLACFSYIMARTSCIQCNDDDYVRFVLDQNDWLNP